MTASAPLAAFLSSIRLPLASPLREAGIEKRVPDKSAAKTNTPSVSPTLAFPAVLGSLVETSEPAATPKEDAGPKEAKPTVPGKVGNSEHARARLCPRAAGLPAAPAVATTTVTLPVAATRAETPAAATSTAPETTAEDLARVTPAAALNGYPATRSKVTAPEAPYPSANGSYATSGKATAGPTPDEEHAAPLSEPAVALAQRSTAPDGDAARHRLNPAAVPEPSLAAWPAPETPPAALPANSSLPLPDSPQPATVPAPRPQEPLAGLSAQPGPPAKHSPDPAWPTPAAALPGGTPSAATPAAIVDRPAMPAAATADRVLFPATTAESTRHSAAAIQSPLPTGAFDPARYGAQDHWEPAAQSGGGLAAELAFGARLVPTAGPVDATAGDARGPLPVPSTTPARPSAAAPLDSAVLEPASETAVTPLAPVIGQTGDAAEDSSPPPGPFEKGPVAAPERFRKSETPAPSSWETSSASAARLSPDTVYAPAERLANASNQPERSAAAEPRPAAVPEPSTDAGPSKPPAAARNIQLDVTGGNRRVEVRLTERGGEVEVAVRTPDAHLASALREDLPALSSRLAESGFRAETWHPASPGASSGAPSVSGEWHKLAESSPGGALQDPAGRSRQNGGQPHDDSQPRQPHTREPQPDRKDQGKDFAWLMSSLR